MKQVSILIAVVVIQDYTCDKIVQSYINTQQMCAMYN